MVPVTFKLTGTATVENPNIGDIHLENGTPVLIGDDNTTYADSVNQQFRNRATFFKGEWFLDQGEGTPWFEDILVENADLGLIRSIFRKILLGTDGVASVDQFDMTRSGRSLTIEYTAKLVNRTELNSKDFEPFILRI